MMVIFGSIVRSRHFQGILKVDMVLGQRVKAGEGNDRCKRLMVKQRLRDRHSLSL
jgi:hypothetical protein